MSELRSHADLGDDAASGFRFGVVVSRFNPRLTGALFDAAQATLVQYGAAPEAITVVQVPGAFELPMAAAKVAETGVDAVLCIGAVIRGETPHFEYICSAVAHGIEDVALQRGIPVLFGVLTCEELAQAEARAGGDKGNKGVETALAAIEMVQIYAALAETD